MTQQNQPTPSNGYKEMIRQSKKEIQEGEFYEERHFGQEDNQPTPEQLAEQIAQKAAKETEQAVGDRKLGGNPTVWKIAIWAARIAITQATEAKDREIERLKEVENGNLLKSRTFEQAVKRAADSVRQEQTLQATITQLESKYALLVETIEEFLNVNGAIKVLFGQHIAEHNPYWADRLSEIQEKGYSVLHGKTLQQAQERDARLMEAVIDECVAYLAENDYTEGSLALQSFREQGGE